MKICEVEDCCKPTYSQGERPLKGDDENTVRFCRKHLMWLRKYGSTDFHRHSQGTVNQRFWKFVSKGNPDECWIWNGGFNAKKYGVMQDTPANGEKRGKTLLAHRISYVIHKGEIPDGMVVMHSCDNPSCVNPNHLSVGTQSRNIIDSIEKNRKTVPYAIGEDNPKSKLTLEQVKFIKSHPELGHKHIADMFGLSPNCIRGVRIGRTWKHV